MKLGIISSVFIAGAAAAAIAAAPSAFGAAVPITPTDPGGNSTLTQRPGHVHMKVTPPDVSDARSYGEFTSPGPIVAGS